MNINIGLWIIPLILTIIFFVISKNYKKPTPGGYINIDVEGAIRNVWAIIGSLIVWLIYALLT